MSRGILAERLAHAACLKVAIQPRARFPVHIPERIRRTEFSRNVRENRHINKRGKRHLNDRKYHTMEQAAAYQPKNRSDLALTVVDDKGQFHISSEFLALAPVGSITQTDALAYIAWLRVALKRKWNRDWTVRLPESKEYEKAIRGADGRLYPYGNRYDGSFANQKGSPKDELCFLQVVGSYPADESPFRVRDGIGGVCSWTKTLGGTLGSETLIVVKGASTEAWEGLSLCAVEQELQRDRFFSTVGFRLAADLPAEEK